MIVVSLPKENKVQFIIFENYFSPLFLNPHPLSKMLLPVIYVAIKGRLKSSKCCKISNWSSCTMNIEVKYVLVLRNFMNHYGKGAIHRKGCYSY